MQMLLLAALASDVEHHALGAQRRDEAVDLRLEALRDLGPGDRLRGLVVSCGRRPCASGARGEGGAVQGADRRAALERRPQILGDRHRQRLVRSRLERLDALRQLDLLGQAMHGFRLAPAVVAWQTTTRSPVSVGITYASASWPFGGAHRYCLVGTPSTIPCTPDAGRPLCATSAGGGSPGTSCQTSAAGPQAARRHHCSARSDRSATCGPPCRSASHPPPGRRWSSTAACS